MLSTTLLWALLGLLLVNVLALRHPSRPVARCCSSVLMLALLLCASVPSPATALRPLLLLATIGTCLALSWSLTRPSPGDDERGANYLITALVVSLASGALVALRPHPFEYPGDTVFYLNSTQGWALQTGSQGNCLSGSARSLTYLSPCTLWGALMQASPLSASQLLSGIPQRLAIGLPVSIFGLSVFRLLQYARIGPLSASLSWLFISIGLGNQSIAFIINHSLQGSVLGATVFLEAVMVILAILRMQGRSYRPLLLLPIAIAPLLYLQLRLHGIFAMLTLALLVPCMAAVGVQAWLTPGRGLVNRRTGAGLISLSLGMLALALALKTGWAVDSAKLGGDMAVRWYPLTALGVPETQLPASYIIKAPAGRPEFLAIVSLIASAWIVLRPSKDHDDAGYRELASLFNLSILAIYLLPPFSHLYINLANELNSLYRLMWGMILFSPLPALLDDQFRAPNAKGWTRARLLRTAAAALTALGVLIPIPLGSRQALWSKTRHLVQGPSSRVDQLHISQALMPAILTIQQQIGRPPIVLADPIIGYTLYGYPGLVSPIDPARITSPLDSDDSYTHTKLSRIRDEKGLKAFMQAMEAIVMKPDLIIQQSPINPYYSPYIETGNYDQGTILSLARTGSNALSEGLLNSQGYQLWQNLDEHGQPVAINSAATTYRLWLSGDGLNRR